MLKGLELIKKNRNKKEGGGLVEKPSVAESLEGCGGVVSW